MGYLYFRAPRVGLPSTSLRASSPLLIHKRKFLFTCPTFYQPVMNWYFPSPDVLRDFVAFLESKGVRIVASERMADLLRQQQKAQPLLLHPARL